MHLSLVVACTWLVFSFAAACERRNYEDNCPSGWMDLGNNACRAPLSYTGLCGTLMTIGDAVRDEGWKQGIERKCGVTWPCEDACEPDYSAPCPLNWLDMGNSICEAPLEYDQNCLKRVRMADERFKRDFAIECGLRWPCLRECAQDFGQPCPKDWYEVEDGVCEAARGSYDGACLSFANLLGFANQEKAHYAALCNVEFPCVSASANAECEPTDAPCPKGWGHKGSVNGGVCYSVEYEGPCRPIVFTESLAAIGKLKFMEECNVVWECKSKEPESGYLQDRIASSFLHSGPVNNGGYVVGASARLTL